MRILLFVATSFLLLVSFPTDLHAQSGTRKFSLLVTNLSKQRIANADVELIDNFGNVLKAKTDKDGIATFDIGTSENYTKGRAKITSSSNRFLCPISINSRLTLLTIEMPDDMVIMAEDPGDLSIGNPRKYFTSFESQASNALNAGASMINNVTDDCKIIDLDKQVKAGLEAGQAALASKRKFAAQMLKEEGKWQDNINEIAGTKPWYPFGKEDVTWPHNAMAPSIGIESQWRQIVPYHNERVNAQKVEKRIVELLSKLSALCSRTQSAGNIINQKIEKYEQLYLSGCEAADKCDFSNASIILSQLRELERRACGHFYPKPFGFIKSDNLDKRILRNKDRCKTGVPDELPIDPSWMSTVLYKVFPACDNKNDPRNTIEDVKVWMYFDGKRISATGSSTMFPAGSHTLKIEVEPRDGAPAGNATYLIKRVEWMRCAGGVYEAESPLGAETPNAKEVTMKVNILVNSDKNHCYKAVIYTDKCGRN